MERYEIEQVITYLVEADSPSEALTLWNNDTRTGVIGWESDKISLVDESVQVQCECC